MITEGLRLEGRLEGKWTKVEDVAAVANKSVPLHLYGHQRTRGAFPRAPLAEEMEFPKLVVLGETNRRIPESSPTASAFFISFCPIQYVGERV